MTSKAKAKAKPVKKTIQKDNVITNSVKTLFVPPPDEHIPFSDKYEIYVDSLKSKLWSAMLNQVTFDCILSILFLRRILLKTITNTFLFNY